MTVAMRTILPLSIILFLLHAAVSRAAPDLAGILEANGVNADAAALLIVHIDDGQSWSSGAQRIDARYPPASTAKIPHTLIALETGYADGPDKFFMWDGKSRFVREWNSDQTLASAYRHSVVWAYQQIAEALGFETMASWIRKFDYGNADTGGEEDLSTYWLVGPLEISAREQVDFLSRLVREALPVTAKTLQTGKAIMQADAGNSWVLYAKTGWRLNEAGPDIGWYVGWVENDNTGTYVFAFNLDVANDDDLRKRKTVVRAALDELGAFSN